MKDREHRGGPPAAARGPQSGQTIATPARRPPPLNAGVAAQMSRMPRASTGPELAIRRELHRRGLRFRVNYRALPGRPDVAFTRARIAVFVDGCFWHRCPEHGTLPKNNREWWLAKLDRNVERDREKDLLLEQAGWAVIHLWEHDDPVVASDRIQDLWRSLTSFKRVGDLRISGPVV